MVTYLNIPQWGCKTAALFVVLAQVQSEDGNAGFAPLVPRCWSCCHLRHWHTLAGPAAGLAAPVPPPQLPPPLLAARVQQLQHSLLAALWLPAAIVRALVLRTVIARARQDQKLRVVSDADTQAAKRKAGFDNYKCARVVQLWSSV